MKDRGKATVIRFDNTLGEIFHRPGGVARDEAVSSAEERVENLRDDLVPALLKELTKAEKIAFDAPDPLPSTTITELFHHECVIFNLAGTFGYAALQSVAAGLSDLLKEMADHGECPRDAVLVHLRAAQLLAPGAAPMSAEEQTDLLKRLVGVRTYLGVHVR